jgi:hypothetical protein
MKSKFILFGLAGALAVSTVQAQDHLGPDHSLTLAPADPASSASGGATDDEQAKEAELAKKLQNPVANLISVPIQNNWDFGIGPANAMRYTANIQPVIPFTLTKDWNLITRTILPVIYAESPVVGGRPRGEGETIAALVEHGAPAWWCDFWAKAKPPDNCNQSVRAFERRPKPLPLPGGEGWGGQLLQPDLNAKAGNL